MVPAQGWLAMAMWLCYAVVNVLQVWHSFGQVPDENFMSVTMLELGPLFLVAIPMVLGGLVVGMINFGPLFGLIFGPLFGVIFCSFRTRAGWDSDPGRVGPGTQAGTRASETSHVAPSLCCKLRANRHQ